MARIIECFAAHYETEELEGAKTYRWRPGYAVVECGCGEKLDITGAARPCSCGEDYSTVLKELADREPEKEDLRAALLRDYYEWKSLNPGVYDDTYRLEMAELN